MALKRDPKTGEVLDTETGSIYSNIDQARANIGQKATGTFQQSMPITSQRYQLGHPLSDQMADVTTGGPAGQRALAGIKITPQGKVGYLESQYGQGNVAVRDDGTVFVRKSPQEQWMQFDERGFGMGDITELSGPAIETAPVLAAGLLTQNPVAVGGAAAGGNVMRQAASGLLPGEEDLTTAQRVGMPLLSGATAGVAQFGLNKAFPVVDMLRPSNIVARNVQRQMDTPFARRGEFLQEKIPGLQFTPGEQSGSRGMLTVEGMARRHPASADVFAKQVDQPSIQAIYKNLDNLVNRVSSEGGAVTTGAKVENTFKGLANKLIDARRMQADKDFGELSRVAGNRGIIPTENVVNEIDNIIADFSTPGSGQQAQQLINGLQSLKRDFATKVTPSTPVSTMGRMTGGRSVTGEVVEPRMLTANEAKNLLSTYSKYTQGTGQLFKDLEKGQQRMIASRILQAMERDLGQATESGAAGSEIVSLLKNARDNYRVNSQKIDDIAETTLGRLFGGRVDKSPEAIANAIKNMQPSEIRASIGILNQQDPGTANTVRRFMIEEAMTAARPSGSTQVSQASEILGGAGIKYDAQLISPKKFVSYINKNSDKFLAAGYKPKELVDMKRAYEAMARIADRAGTEGSPTWPLMMAWDAAKGFVSGNPADLARGAVTMAAPNKIARLVATPEGRKALMTVTQSKGVTSQKSKAYTNAMAYLNSVFLREDEPTPESAPAGMQAVQEQQQQ